MVQRTLMAPPRSQFGPVDEKAKKNIIEKSPLRSTYDQEVDRESAYELLNKREEELIKRREAQAKTLAAEKAAKKSGRSSGGSRRQGVGEAFLKSVARAVGSKLGRQIVRGILGSIVGGK
jgi:high-affinity K+ transport system ATPase subunit B